MAESKSAEVKCAAEKGTEHSVPKTSSESSLRPITGDKETELSWTTHVQQEQLQPCVKGEQQTVRGRKTYSILKISCSGHSYDGMAF